MPNTPWSWPSELKEEKAQTYNGKMALNAQNHNLVLRERELIVFTTLKVQNGHLAPWTPLALGFGSGQRHTRPLNVMLENKFETWYECTQDHTNNQIVILDILINLKTCVYLILNIHLLNWPRTWSIRSNQLTKNKSQISNSLKE